MAEISGAIVFHLFTPLGVEVQGDGGLLFGMAVGVWIAAAIIAFLQRDALLGRSGRGGREQAQSSPSV